MAGKIFAIQEAEQAQFPATIPETWTAVIPAAGRGSRLNFELPKILFPINGKPILYWLLDNLQKQCNEIILVVNPETVGIISTYCQKYGAVPVRFAIQPEPRGMADAIQRSLAHVNTTHLLTIWGDQVALKRRTIDICQRLHQSHPLASMTMPTIMKHEPYLSFVRDDRNRLSEVREFRETGIKEKFGESDCGFFCFQTGILKSLLESARAQGLGLGKTTGEFNLLPLFPLFELHGSIMTIRINDESETLGVNNRADAELASKILAMRSVHAE